MRNNVGVLCAMAVLALAGIADAQGPGGRGRGGGFGRGGLISLAGNEAVQKELALSDDATTKVKELSEEYQADVRKSMGDQGNFRDMSREERTKAMEKMQESGKAINEKLLPKLKTILTADQFSRLQQVHWQVMGTAAFTDAEVVKALTITSDQQDKIKSTNSDFDSKQGEIFREGGGGGGGGGGAIREKMEELNKERQTKVEAILTKDQLSKFATLTGAKFDVAQIRRGPGGPGGPGGGQGARGKRPQPKPE